MENTHPHKIIDGRALALKHQQILTDYLQNQKTNWYKHFPNRPFINPSIISFCNSDDPPSVKYTLMKYQKAKEIGIDFIAQDYSLDTPQSILAELVIKYNKDPQLDGIMLQLPLPDNLAKYKQFLLNSIDPKKDVDGLTGQGRKFYLPATVKGVISILDEVVKSNWQDKLIGVVGAEGEVGKPLIEALDQKGAKNIVKIDIKIGDINSDLKPCDIVISSTGQPGLIKKEMLKQDVIALDIGLGDFHPDVYQLASLYTPKVGGVGPMTVISLMENIIIAADARIQNTN